MPDTYPPAKTERPSIIPMLAETISNVPAIVRERVSGFFSAPAELPQSKQSILTDFLLKSKNESVTPKLISDILMGRCSDKKLLHVLKEEAEIIYPEAVIFFNEKIEKINNTF